MKPLPSRLLKNIVILFLTALTNAIVDEWHHTGTGSDGNPNAHGLSIHYCSISEFNFDGHSYAYMDGYTWDHPLEFVADSTWVPH